MIEQRFIAYYRVSTGRQGRSGLGLEAQRETVSQFLAGRAANVVGEFVEIESGGKDDRPKLHEALAACQRSKAILLIAKLDRLARSVAFIANLMDSGTEFVACDMPTASRLLLHVMAAFAEHERQIIGERTRAALAAAKVRGIKLGTNGAVLAAANRTTATTYAYNVKEAFLAAFSAGAHTTREIAAHLNGAGVVSRQGGRWHPASVSRVLRRMTPSGQ
jgi:DNA invertase Pin-like site-specific DNA recombinase